MQREIGIVIKGGVCSGNSKTQSENPDSLKGI